MRDADRTKQLLLAAALEEFAQKGYAGARVLDIASRAGVNKQLITYYFGGKRGLAQAVEQAWEAQEATFVRPDQSLEEMIAGYLHATLTNPLITRMLVWEGLNGDDSLRKEERNSHDGSSDVTELTRRQAAGELSAETDPRFLLLLFMGAIAAPVILPQVARRVTGLDPSSQEFEACYLNELQLVARHLRR